MAAELSREFATHSCDGTSGTTPVPFSLRVQMPGGVLGIGMGASGEGWSRGATDDEEWEQGVYAVPMFEDAMAGRGGASAVCCWVCFLVDRE